MPFTHLNASLKERSEQGLLRQRRLLDSPQGARVQVDGRDLLSFCSNDYLGLANHPTLIRAACEGAQAWGVGAGASHLITGHLQPHHALEVELAQFVGLPAALLFSTGYMANLGIVTALLGRHDAIFSDKLNHASLNDAAHLSRANLHRYPHGSLVALEQALSASKAARKLVVSDAVFSMDGDTAPVPGLLALCERYDAWLLLDDAHGFGVLGTKGKGVLEHFVCHSSRIIYMATLGKAAGVAGAFVAGDQTLIDYLVQHARSYVYTTAAPPLQACALQASLKLIEEEAWRRDRLKEWVIRLQDGLNIDKGRGWHLMPSSTPIQPLVIGASPDAVKVSERLLSAGILVPAIRPPTVPQGSARLRISLSAAHTAEEIDRLIETLNRLEAT